MPPITAAPTSPAASPGPQPPPRHRASAGDVDVRAVMPMVTAVVKANTVLFMSLTLSGLSEPLTGEPRIRFQSGRSAANLERSWHGQPRHCASTASAVGRVKISILLWGYGRMAGKLVPPRGDGLILARTNDDISRLGVMRTGAMHFCSVGRSAEGDQNA